MIRTQEISWFDPFRLSKKDEAGDVLRQTGRPVSWKQHIKTVQLFLRVATCQTHMFMPCVHSNHISWPVHLIWRRIDYLIIGWVLQHFTLLLFMGISEYIYIYMYILYIYIHSIHVYISVYIYTVHMYIQVCIYTHTCTYSYIYIYNIYIHIYI